MKKCYKISPVSSLSFKPVRLKLTNELEDCKPIDIGGAFESYLLDDVRVAQLPHLLDEKGIVYDVETVSFILQKLPLVKSLLIEKDSLAPADLVVGYRVLQGLLDLYGQVYPDWKFIVGQAPSHRLESYDATRFHFSTFSFLSAHASQDFVFSFIE